MSMEISSKHFNIPHQTYLYFPKDTAPKNGAQRNIFDGMTRFTPGEQEMIDKFRRHCGSHNYELKPTWSDNMILRFLYANNFKMSKTLISVKEHTHWRETALPVKVDSALQELLNSGLLYVHGRDNQFHPIVVFNVCMLDTKNINVDLITRVLTYWFEYLIDEWMLPGQVENWVFIVDVKGMGVGTILHPSVRKLFAYLQDNYKCRLYKLFVLNATPAIYIPWKIVKTFLDEVTVEKIQICSSQIPVGLLKFTNPEQVETRFGGSAQNVTQYWPPIIPSDNYFISSKDSEHIIPKETYVSLYKQGSLKNTRINKAIIGDPIEVENLPEEIIKKESLYYSVNFEEKDELNFDKHLIASLPSRKAHTLHQAKINNLFQHTKSENTEEEEGSEANYVDYMSEKLENNYKENYVREFQTSFLPKAPLARNSY